jgi:uncharacterized membrane protein
MTSSGGEQQGDQQQGQGGLLSTLGDAAKGYAVARGQDVARKAGEKLSGVTGSLNETAEGGGFKATAAGETVRRAVSGESPVKAALGGIGSGIKGLFSRKKGGGSGNKKFMNIVEDISVGVPVNVAYDQWTQFQEFASFMKGVESVDQTDETNSNWRVKVAKSRRNFKATVTEQIPDRKIAWTTEGAKGTVKGVVTFHPLADDLTQILLVMEYYPQGLFEKTGNIWRAQGRRTRLDLKHFRRFIMMRGEATGSWRGEIRDSEVVRGPEDEEGPEDQSEDQTQDEGLAEEEGSEEGEESEEGAEPEEGEGYEDEGTADEEPDVEPAEEEEPEEEPSGEGRPRRRQPAGAR